MSTTADRLAANPRSTLGRGREDVHPEVVEAMDELVSRLAAKRDEFPPICQVLLYGSHARGDYHKDSDVDVVVVFDAPERGDLIWRMSPCVPDLPSLPTILETLPILKGRMDDPESTINPHYYRNVQRDGIEWPMPA